MLQKIHYPTELQNCQFIHVTLFAMVSFKSKFTLPMFCSATLLAARFPSYQDGTQIFAPFRARRVLGIKRDIKEYPKQVKLWIEAFPTEQ